jgi:integrase
MPAKKVSVAQPRQKLVTVTEGPVKITKSVIDKAWKRRAKDQRIIIRDLETAGLALIVNAQTMRWECTHRPRGKDPATGKRWPNKPLTLGNPESLSIEDARHAAAAHKGHAAAGGDPHAERKAKAAKEAADRAATVKRLLDQYEIALPLRPKLRGSGLPSDRHVAEEIAHARSAAKTMDVAELPVSAVDASHIRRLLTAEAARPATARARFGAFSRFLDWAQDEGTIAINPCVAVSKSRRPKPAPARAHYLTPEQLAVMWKAAASLDPLYRDVVRLLIALPCRRGEAINLEWQHVDLAGATWSQPGAMTKNGEPHRLHLHKLALDLLTDRHRAAGKPRAGLVFPAPRSERPIDTFTAIKAEMETETGLTGWRWHDFRRSFATVLGEAGLPEPVLDACLNHRQSATRSGVLGVYQRAQRWPEQVAAMTAWGEALRAAIQGRKPASKVVQLHAVAQ